MGPTLNAQKRRAPNAEARLFSNDQEKFRAAFELVGVGIGLVDQKGKFFEVNRKLSEIFAIGKEELLGMTIDALPVPAGNPPALSPEQVVIEGDGSAVPFEKRFVTGQGEIVWTEISYKQLLAQAGSQAGYIVSFHDITQRKSLEIALARQATIDPLTQALNRSSFAERANVELVRSGRHRYKLSLVMVDIDQFKTINDTYGHAVGDEVLGVVGDMTRECLRLMDLFGRWGGEEFLLLLPDTGPADAKRVSERIRASLESHKFACGARITASFGVAAQRSGESFGALVDRADTAMYRAKQSGRNRVFVDAEDLRRESARKSVSVGVFELHWRKIYACGIEKIDAEHEQLFSIANQVLGVLSLGGDMSVLEPLVDELLTHIATHFKNEEQLLEAGGFPKLAEHQLSHGKLLAHANTLAEQFRQQQITAGALLGFVIHDVVAGHMIQEDRKYYSWMKKPRQGKATSDKPGASKSGQAGKSRRRLPKPSPAA